MSDYREETAQETLGNIESIRRYLDNVERRVKKNHESFDQGECNDVIIGIRRKLCDYDGRLLEESLARSVLCGDECDCIE